VAPKYRNPGDASQTWTGRGRQPAWVAEALAGGARLEDLAIG
jgi:DNA-binding protein H-NS